jgi:hypothetical protein
VIGIEKQKSYQSVNEIELQCGLESFDSTRKVSPIVNSEQSDMSVGNYCNPFDSKSNVTPESFRKSYVITPRLAQKANLET